jgi:Mg-chelatase subunit ChlD
MLSINAYPIRPTQVCIRLTATAAPASASASAEAEATTIRTPVHFIAAVDVSASMAQSQQLANVVTSLKFLLDYMTADDALSVITFSTDAQVVIRQEATTPEKKEMIRFCLDRLLPDSMTNLSAALSCVPELVLAGTPHKQGLLLLTDGEVNRGLTDPAALTGRVSALLAAHPSLSLTLVGYGEGHNAELCRSMATATSGTYDVVHTLDHVATVFGNTLGGLMTCALQQVRIPLPPDVRQGSAYPERDGCLFVGDIQIGNEVIVLLEAAPGLVVRGTSVLTGVAFETPVVIHADPTPEEVMVGLVTSLRFRVVALLERVQRSFAGDCRDECAELRRLLGELPPSSLVTLLLAEVDRCSAITESPAPPSRHQTTLLSQRTAYLGLGRGILSEEDPTAGSLDRTFSNSVQRNMSEGMRQSIASPSAQEVPAVPPPPPRTLTRTYTQM